MSEEELERTVLDRLAVDRREFVRRFLRGAAFAAPVIASFDMNTALADARRARHRGSVRNPTANGPRIYLGNGWQTNSRHAFPYDQHHGDDPNWAG
jgi:hypothetical protein